MVTTIDMRLEEKAQNDKLKELLEITRGIVDCKISVGISDFSVLVDLSKTINVNVPANEVSAFRRHYGTALRLAEAYEEFTGEDFIVKKY